MERAEHLQWCKDRALEYVERGDLGQAIASMKSDLSKHPETKVNKSVEEALDMLLLSFTLTKETVTRWIKGFN